MPDLSKMPPGLLKEIPGKANMNARSKRQMALKRRLDKSKTEKPQGK